MEHSADAEQYTRLSIIEAAGNSSVKKYYSYIHKNPIWGTNYYRLKMVDQNLSSEHSPVRDVMFDTENNVVITLYPNPASQFVNLKIEGLASSDQLRLKIDDINGRKMLTKSLKASAPLIYQVNTANFSTGIYLVRVSVNGKEYVVRLSIQH